MRSPRLTPEVFAILSALIEEHLGLHHGPRDRDLLESKVGARAAEIGFDSLLDYYYYLRYDPDAAQEMEALTDLLVVNESYLFREIEPLRVIVQELLAPRAEAAERPRVWSAGCARGEEAYTLAMLLEERGLLDRVDIVASDVSERALAEARAGRLGRRAIRSGAEPKLVERWVDLGGPQPTVRPPLRDAVDFRRVNLLDDAAVRALGTFDVVLCRNVLIYFSDATTRAVVDRLLDRLREGGSLWVGVSESLMRLGTSLTCSELGSCFFYRRAD